MKYNKSTINERDTRLQAHKSTSLEEHVLEKINEASTSLQNCRQLNVTKDIYVNLSNKPSNYIEQDISLNEPNDQLNVISNINNKIENELKNEIMTKKNNFLSQEKCYANKDSPDVNINESIHNCRKCNQEFETQSLLEIHLQTHNKKDENVGKIDIFEKENLENKHRKIILENGKNKIFYVCPICKMAFPYITYFRMHFKSHNPNLFHDLIKQEEEENHSYGINKNQNNLSSLKIKNFSTEDENNPNDEDDGENSKQKTINEFINDISNFQCHHCNRYFKNSLALKIHLNSHKKDKLFNRRGRGRKTNEENDIQIFKHIERSILKNGKKINFHICPICKRTFQFLSYLKIHYKSHGITTANEEHFVKKDEEENVIKHLKNIDKSAFTKEQKVEINKSPNNSNFEENYKNNEEKLIIKMHDILCNCHNCMKNKNENKKLHECIFCNKKFKYLSHLTLHKRNHKIRKNDSKNKEIILKKNINKLQCNICGRKFKTFNWLKYHLKCHKKKNNYNQMENNSINDKSIENKFGFNCPICQKWFRFNSKLNLHLKSHERGTKPPNKKIRLIKNKKNLSHQKEDKIEGKHQQHQFECPECTMQFKYSYFLKLHLITHRNLDKNKFKVVNSLYQCIQCNKSFKFLSWIKSHLTTHKKNQKKMKKDENLTMNKTIKIKKKKKASISNKSLNIKNISIKHKILNDKKQNKKLLEQNSITCLICSKIYFRKKNLINHFKKVHFFNI